MNFDEIKQNILNSSETSMSESESISNSELHEEFEINNFLPEFEPLKLSGKNLAQQYVSAFNTGMNVYQCLNYLQGYVYTLVTAMNETIEAWNTVAPLLEQATKEWTDEEFDYKWSILKPQVIELVTNLTLETFNNAWEELKPVVIKLAQDTTDAEFKKQWDILKPQVITLVEETTTNKFNEEWEKLRPTIIQLSTDTTIEQFNRSWEELRPQVIELSQQTTSDKFDEKWEELQPTLTETVNNLVNTNLDIFKSTLWQEVTKNNDFPFLLPENFGAVGDGTTDDHNAFNTCFAKAMETGKYVLLSNKTYVINSSLNDITSVNIIGINASIKLLRDIVFTHSMVNCNIKGINFYRDEVIQSCFVNIFDSSCLIKCSFNNLFKLFEKVSSHRSKHILLSNCNLHNTSLINTENEYTGTTYIINNTTINIEHYSYFIYGKLGGTIIFNNCDINKNMPNDSRAMFKVYDNIIFNDCDIKSVDRAVMFTILDIDSLNNINISFNNCFIDFQNRNLIDFTVTKNIYATFKFINTKIVAIAVAQGGSDLSLWFENCILNTNYRYVGIGNANIIEIQQKYNRNTQNVFPWISEIPSIYENNVKLIKVNNKEYYILTESKDKNIKKLDYYFKYDTNYLPNAPYYTNNIIVKDLDLEGYTVKRSLLSNNTCKLKNKSTGELIDYVYLVLDDNVTVTTEKDDQQVVFTTIAMKYLPYFAKLKTDTPIEGQCYVDACVSIILEKTSS